MRIALRRRLTFRYFEIHSEGAGSIFGENDKACLRRIGLVESLPVSGKEKCVQAERVMRGVRERLTCHMQICFVEKEGEGVDFTCHSQNCFVWNLSAGR